MDIRYGPQALEWKHTQSIFRGIGIMSYATYIEYMIITSTKS